MSSMRKRKRPALPKTLPNSDAFRDVGCRVNVSPTVTREFRRRTAAKMWKRATILAIVPHQQRVAGVAPPLGSDAINIFDGFVGLSGDWRFRGFV